MEYINEKLIELNNFLQRSKIAIIGLGVSNIPLLDYMHNLKANVTVFDDREIESIPKDVLDKVTNYHYNFSFGKASLSKLNGFDIIFRAPSCMPTREELKKEADRGAIITTEIEMVLKIFPGKVVGITGSDGKTTTTTLIYEILKNNGYNCYLGGNIGIPLFTKLNEMKPEDIVVLELSSFQLMEMEVSPDISVITNITPNHLNIHSSYEEYIEAKKNIFKYQNENGIVVLNYDNDITKACGKEAEGKVILYSSKEKLEDGIILDNDIIKECKDKLRRHLVNTKDLIIRGKHMHENVCAALAATSTLVEPEDAIKTIKNFKGVEHRLEFVRELNGVKWYNDSIGTSPTRTMAGLNSFDERITLIAGGYDKNLDYKPLAVPILEKVDNLVLVGQTATKIFEVVKEEMEKQKKNINIYVCDEFKEAILTAKRVTKSGDIVLLSPASASFDMFKNFADKGNKFKELVNEL